MDDFMGCHERDRAVILIGRHVDLVLVGSCIEMLRLSRRAAPNQKHAEGALPSGKIVGSRQILPHQLPAHYGPKGGGEWPAGQVETDHGCDPGLGKDPQI